MSLVEDDPVISDHEQLLPSPDTKAQDAGGVRLKGFAAGVASGLTKLTVGRTFPSFVSKIAPELSRRFRSI